MEREICPECGVVHPYDHDDLDEEMDPLEDELAELVFRSLHQLDGFLRRLPEKERHHFSELPANTLIRFFCLSAKARKKVVERSHTVQQFAANVLANESFSEDGADFLAVMGPVDAEVTDLLREELSYQGIMWQGPPVTEPPKAKLVAAPAAVAAQPSARSDAPPHAIRDKAAIGQWLRRRSGGDTAWLDLQTSDGPLRGTFAIDAVQKRGKDFALLVSADWMERGRVVYEREILGACDALESDR